MPTMKMTKAGTEKLPAPDPSGKPTLYWAEGTATPGLGILVSGISPTKSWVCQGNLPKEGLISRFLMAQITPSATGWLKNASIGTKFPSFRSHPLPQAVFRTHSACQVRNRSRTRNRLASAQVTNSRCAFLSSPR